MSLSGPQDYPPDTILGNLRVSIFGNDTDGAVNIFHEGVFEDPVVGFEYYPKARNLVFLFEDDMAMAFGSTMDSSLVPYIMEAKDIGLYQLNDEGVPIGGKILPLKIIEE